MAALRSMEESARFQVRAIHGMGGGGGVKSLLQHNVLAGMTANPLTCPSYTPVMANE